MKQLSILAGALFLAAPLAHASGLARQLSGNGAWTTAATAPAALQQQLAGAQGLDCQLEHYAAGSTLDCVVRRPLSVMGMTVSEFYVSTDAAGSRQLRLVLMPPAARIERIAARALKLTFTPGGSDHWTGSPPGAADRRVEIGPREDGRGELAFVIDEPLPADVAAAGATDRTGVIEGAIAIPDRLPAMRVCAIDARGEAACQAVAAGANRYRITGVRPGTDWVIGYASGSPVHPAYARDFNACPAGRPGCPNGILRTIAVHAGQVLRVDLEQRFEQLPANLRRIDVAPTASRST
ncbi:MAG: hypothetical protein KGH73_07175 [Xanthomonadaceae bacterium]|nr:hypothetical protein [Xanthomonadaceae bacterium]